IGEDAAVAECARTKLTAALHPTDYGSLLHLARRKFCHVVTLLERDRVAPVSQHVPDGIGISDWSTEKYVVHSRPRLRWLFRVEHPPGRAERAACVMRRGLDKDVVEESGVEN